MSVGRRKMNLFARRSLTYLFIILLFPHLIKALWSEHDTRADLFRELQHSASKMWKISDKYNILKKPDEFSVLTYNVAGLPEIISQSLPSQNTPLISKKINAYDLVLMQEDFWYDRQLAENARHLFKSSENGLLYRGSGLREFSYTPYTKLGNLSWQDCHGVIKAQNDCLTRKGFTYGKKYLHEENLPNTSVDIYNVHFDAGSEPGDYEARQKQLNQLSAFLTQRSEDQAVIIAGDFNMHGRKDNILDNEEMKNFSLFLSKHRLKDATQKLSSPEEREDRLDRILYRGNKALKLTLKKTGIPTDFVDMRGFPLSDHRPFFANFAYYRSE